MLGQACLGMTVLSLPVYGLNVELLLVGSTATKTCNISLPIQHAYCTLEILTGVSKVVCGRHGNVETSILSHDHGDDSHAYGGGWVMYMFIPTHMYVHSHSNHSHYQWSFMCSLVSRCSVNRRGAPGIHCLSSSAIFCIQSCTYT